MKLSTRNSQHNKDENQENTVIKKSGKTADDL